MSEAEKLQKLIELAWENGFDKFNEHSGLVFKPEYYQDCSVEQIIFSHDFIKALSLAKYPKGRSRSVFLSGERGRYVDWSPPESVWIDIISDLAISTNRIDYLYDTFIEGK